MQVEGGGATHSPANGCVTRERPALPEGDSRPNGRVRPHTLLGLHGLGRKARKGAGGGARGLSASWRGNGSPRRRRVAGLRGWPATLGLRDGPDSYGRQQWGILRNGRKADAATPRVGGSSSGCKPLLPGTNDEHWLM